MEARSEQSTGRNKQQPPIPREGSPQLGAPAQRWRLTFARDADPDRRTNRELADEWLTRLRGSGLPLQAPSGRLRVPLTFAAPLPAGMACEEELADLWLRDGLQIWRVREAVVPTLPA